jgi:hypothetical protein
VPSESVSFTVPPAGMSFQDDDGQVYLFFQGKPTLKGDYLLSCAKVKFID